MGAMPVFASVDALVYDCPVCVMPKATADSVALGTWAVPESATLVAPEPLCVNAKVPVRVPAVVGVKMTETVQLPLTATVAQLLVCE